MTSPAELYVNGIKKKLKHYWAAWLPSTRFSLGDVGILKGNFFHGISSLKNVGIEFKEDRDKEPSPIDYVSESGVSVHFKMTGETNDFLPTIPQAKSGIGIEFSKQGAFVVQAAETYEQTIKDLLHLQDQIIPAFMKGDWDKNWAVIIKIIEAPVASFLISNSSESKIEFSAEADLSSGLAELGKASAKFAIHSQKGDVLKILGAKGVSPLFMLAQIKSNFLGSPSFSTKSFTGTNQPIDFITPKNACENKEIADSLTLDLVLDP